MPAKPRHFCIVNVNVGRDYSDEENEFRIRLLCDLTWPSLQAQDGMRVVLVPFLSPDTKAPSLERLLKHTDNMRIVSASPNRAGFAKLFSDYLYSKCIGDPPDWIVTTLLNPGDVLGVTASRTLCERAARLQRNACLRLDHGYQYLPGRKVVRSVDHWADHCLSLGELCSLDKFQTCLGFEFHKPDECAQVEVPSPAPAYAARLPDEGVEGRIWEPAADYVRFFGPGFADLALT